MENKEVKIPELITVLYKVDRKLFAIGYDSDHEIVKEVRNVIDSLRSAQSEFQLLSQEVERLKVLINDAWNDGYGKSNRNTLSQSWNEFSKQNNL